MNQKKRSIQEEYVDFMGTWMGGSIVGATISKLVILGFVIWVISKIIG